MVGQEYTDIILQSRNFLLTFAFQCIYSVTENNPSAVTAVLAREAEMTSLLTSAADVTTTPSQLYVKVLVCGIVLNTVNSSGTLTISYLFRRCAL